MFTKQLGHIMKVYTDDILKKSPHIDNHIKHLTAYFNNLNKHGMKFNPTKCIFIVTYGKLLGYFFSKKENRDKPIKKIIAITDHASPKNTKEVHQLTSCIAALNIFILWLHDMCLPLHLLFCGATHMLNEMLNAKMPSNY